MYGLLVTGDFMKLADVTRNTLIHYDNLGLLKPVETNERGDRFYHPFQWYTVVLIKTYQLAGISLADIKEFLDGNRTGSNRETFKEYADKCINIKKDLNRRFFELRKVYRYIIKMTYLTGIFDRYKLGGEPVIEKLDLSGGLRKRELDQKMYMRSAAYYGEVNRQLYDTYNTLRDRAFPIVTHFDREDFYEGKNSVHAISSYTLGKADISFEGMAEYDCIILRRLGNVTSVMNACNEIRDVMMREGYELVRDVYAITNIFAFDQEGKRHGDRLIFAPVKKCEGMPRRIKKWEANNYVSNAFETESMRKNLLSTGEFIKICNITRNALNFYEKNGLVKPEYIAKNGYKYYGLSQVSALINVKCLRQAEFSIEQIKEVYMGEYLNENFLVDRTERLKIQQKVIYEKLRQTARTQNYLKILIKALTSMANDLKAPDVPVYNDDRKYFRKIPFDPLTFQEMKGIERELMKVIRKGKESEELLGFPIGISINADCERESLCTVNVVNSKFAREDDVVVVGRNMIYIIACKDGQFTDTLKKLRDRVVAQGYKVRGDIVSLFMNVNDEVSMKMNCLVMIPIE